MQQEQLHKVQNITKNTFVHFRRRLFCKTSWIRKVLILCRHRLRFFRVHMSLSLLFNLEFWFDAVKTLQVSCLHLKWQKHVLRGSLKTLSWTKRLYITSGKSDCVLAATQNNSFAILDLNISQNQMFHFGWTQTYSSLYLFVV